MLGCHALQDIYLCISIFIYIFKVSLYFERQSWSMTIVSTCVLVAGAAPKRAATVTAHTGSPSIVPEGPSGAQRNLEAIANHVTFEINKKCTFQPLPPINAPPLTTSLPQYHRSFSSP